VPDGRIIADDFAVFRIMVRVKVAIEYAMKATRTIRDIPLLLLSPRR
jgi:hypothetical protein